LQDIANEQLAVKLSLKYKFAIFTSVLILVVCITLSLFLMNKVNDELQRQIHLRGTSTISNFAQNAKYSITTRNKAFLQTLVEREVSKEDIVHVIIINEKGDIIGHNNPSLIGRTVTDDYNRSLLETLDKQTVRKVTIPTGETVYDFIMPILDRDIYTSDRYSNLWEVRQRLPDTKNLGIIRIGISFRKMEESLKETYYGVMYISIGIALISIIMSFWYGMMLIKPLTEMTRTANRIAAGYLDERVEITGSDEISILASNFNTMAKSLQESSSNLWKLNKDLEFKVEERTKELKQAYEDLQQIDQLKSNFLSAVSHELRTPLTSILGFARMIHKQFVRHFLPIVPEDDKKIGRSRDTILANLDIITEESKRLARLINDVLDLAKIESGKMQWNREEFSLPVLFNKAVQSVSSLVEGKNVKLEVTADEDIPVICGDRDRIFQVIMNLLSNAIKFTNEGKIYCNIALKDGYLQASVKDSGIGIKETDLLKVFEKFQQVGDTLTEKPQGTGLGLPICKEIIEHHQGQIWADSREGRGSTFYFALPVDDKTPVPENVKEVTFRLESKIQKMEKAEYLILIADEDPEIRGMIKTELEEQGYRTIQAVNGKEAYDLARDYPVNAVIMDIMMCESDGFNTPQHLKNDPKTKDVPIMLLSIILQEDGHIRMGATSYLTEPISADKILNRTSEILRMNSSASILDARLVFLGFGKMERKHYQDKLKQMGLRFEHFESFAQLKKSLETELPTAIFVDFKSIQLSPNAFFKAIRTEEETCEVAIVPMIHTEVVASTIDTNPVPVKGTLSPRDITQSINELFGKSRPKDNS
jgi:signal transduction histidine kinase/CheY-like chemotaxis protein